MFVRVRVRACVPSYQFGISFMLMVLNYSFILREMFLSDMETANIIIDLWINVLCSSWNLASYAEEKKMERHWMFQGVWRVIIFLGPLTIKFVSLVCYGWKMATFWVYVLLNLRFAFKQCLVLLCLCLCQISLTVATMKFFTASTLAKLQWFWGLLRASQSFFWQDGTTVSLP